MLVYGVKHIEKGKERVCVCVRRRLLLVTVSLPNLIKDSELFIKLFGRQPGKCRDGEDEDGLQNSAFWFFLLCNTTRIKERGENSAE